jgi:hypothetical protein
MRECSPESTHVVRVVNCTSQDVGIKVEHFRKVAASNDDVVNFGESEGRVWGCKSHASGSKDANRDENK